MVKPKQKTPRHSASLSRKYLGTLRGVTLVKLVCGLVAIGLLLGLFAKFDEWVVLYKVRMQVAQITVFDEAVANFNDKFGGLPGDLLAIQAQREGLPAGNGTPGHGDGDGNISPCNLGWQWHLGCETALFWSHLYVSGMISDNFSADSRFTDGRLNRVGAMDPYLPQSNMKEGLYIAVWNSNASLPAPKPALPYGNYYEISRIAGVLEEKMVDDPKAFTPLEAHAIDVKMDDGLPFTGRVMANGNADWPKDAWGSFAKPGAANCVASNKTYNISYYFQAKLPLCHLAIKFNCCEKD